MGVSSWILKELVACFYLFYPRIILFCEYERKVIVVVIENMWALNHASLSLKMYYWFSVSILSSQDCELLAVCRSSDFYDCYCYAISYMKFIIYFLPLDDIYQS